MNYYVSTALWSQATLYRYNLAASKKICLLGFYRPMDDTRLKDTRLIEGDNTPHEIDRTDSGYGRYAGAAAW